MPTPQAIKTAETPALPALAATFLTEGVSIRFTAKGQSMLPSVRDNDTVLVDPIDFDALRVGDVVLFMAPGEKLMLHRLIANHETQGETIYTMQGDAALHCTEEVLASALLGRATACERNEKTFRLDEGIHRVLGLVRVKFRALRRASHFLTRLPNKLARRLQPS